MPQSPATTLRLILTLMGIVLVIDCLVLMTMGKVNFGTVVPCLIGIIFVAHGIFWQPIKRLINHRPRLQRFWMACWGLFAVWLVSFGVFVVTLNQQINQSHQPLPQVSAVITLGSGTVDGKPTPTLAKRLDTAAPIIITQPHAVIITSGGIGLGRTRSEADIMATYLQQTHGIDFAHIQQEGKSTSTAENLTFSRPILASQGVAITDPIAIVTSDFHTVRAKAIAHRQGYANPIMVASPTPLSIRYNAWFREYFAFVKGWLLDEY